MTAGSTVAVVGPTGSGKSTLAGLLVRLVDPADGTVLLDGVDLRSLREGEVSGQAAFVAQGTFLFDDTVRGNVTLGADFADDEVWAALRVAAADDFVAALPDGAGHPGRRARRDPVRRPAAAAGARAGRRPAAAAAGARRRDQRRRPPVEARILDALRDGDGPRPSSSSPTGRPRSRWPTRWSGSRTARCSPAARTSELLVDGARLRRTRARVLPGRRWRR